MPTHRAAVASQSAICFFSDDYLPAKTGTGVSVSITASALVKQGKRVVVLTTRRAGEPAQETIDGVLVYRLFSLPVFGFPQALATPSQLRNLLLQHRVRIAHFHYLSLLSLIGARVARSLGLPCVFTHHMTVDHLTQPLPLRVFRPLFSWLIARFCASMALQTAPSRNFVEQHRGESPVPLEFLSNAMPTFERLPELSAPRVVERDPQVFNVLFAGRLDREKNLPFLLKAFARALEKNPKLHLSLAGKGIEGERLRTLVDSLGISGSTTFLGWLDRRALAAAYQQADLFVLPSRIETQAIVVLEAMSFGKPVIMSDSIITATELVGHGENGFVVKSDDHRALADALCLLAGDPDLVRRMGAKSKERIARVDLSPSTIAGQLDTLYSALGSPRPHRAVQPQPTENYLRT